MRLARLGTSRQDVLSSSLEQIPDRTAASLDYARPLLSCLTPPQWTFNLHIPRARLVMLDAVDSWAARLVDEGLLAAFMPVDFSGSDGGLKACVEALQRVEEVQAPNLCPFCFNGSNSSALKRSSGASPNTLRH